MRASDVSARLGWGGKINEVGSQFVTDGRLMVRRSACSPDAIKRLEDERGHRTIGSALTSDQYFSAERLGTMQRCTGDDDGEESMHCTRLFADSISAKFDNVRLLLFSILLPEAKLWLAPIRHGEQIGTKQAKCVLALHGDSIDGCLMEVSP